MSEENVERVRWGYEAWNRRDFDWLLEFADAEIEWRPVSVAGETSTEDFARLPGVDAVYHGHEGVRRFMETFIEPWEQVTVDVEELRDSGDCVVAFVRFRALARNGLKVDVFNGQVFSFRGSKVVRFEAFADRAEALEAAGLRE